MAAIQNSMLGMLQTAQTGVAFGTHFKQQREGIVEQVKANIPKAEEAVSAAEAKIAKTQSEITGYKGEAAAARHEAELKYPGDEEAQALYVNDKIGDVKDPYTGEVISPGVGTRIQQAKTQLEKDELELSRAQERLESQYKKLRKYGGKM